MEDNKNPQETSVMPMQPANRSVSVYLDSDRFAQMQRACRALAQSDLVPDMYRVTDKTPENKAIANCMIALDMADRLGANPLMIMQNMYIVHGHPAWSSSFLIATVNSCGRFKPLKFKMDTDGEVNIGCKNVPNITCYAYTSEKGSDTELKGAVISLKMAKAEGWLSKSGSKWITMPEQMLMYRAAAFWTRTYAPEISMGIYTAEENEDIQTAEVIDTRMPRQKITMPAPDETVEQLPDTAAEPVGEAEAKAAEPQSDNTAKQAEAKDQPPY